MTSTLPTYEKSFTQLRHSVHGYQANNIYWGHFKNVGTRDGRLLVSSPMAKPILDRFKSWHQLEYSLPPSVKDRR
jgi:hypothetical protein